MNKNYKFKLLLIFLSILFFSLLTLFGCSSSKNYLVIKNNSGFTLTDVKIEYSNSEQIELGNLYHYSEYKFKLLEPANEKAINLIYTDNKNNVHKLLVIPYLVLAQNKNYTHEIN